MQQEKWGWVAVFNDETVIEQYPETGEDNTLELSKQVIPRMKELKMFLIAGEGCRIGVDFEKRMFLVGDEGWPFFSQDEHVKLVYFITRQATVNIGTGAELEHPKVFTVGYEDSNGKIFLNMQEGTGAVFLSTTGI